MIFALDIAFDIETKINLYTGYCFLGLSHFFSNKAKLKYKRVNNTNTKCFGSKDLTKLADNAGPPYYCNLLHTPSPSTH